MLRTFGIAPEHNAALMGIAVHPLARSDSVIENMKSVVRSSRNCGYLTITAIAKTFKVIFKMITALMTETLISSKSLTSISNIQHDLSNVANQRNMTNTHRVSLYITSEKKHPHAQLVNTYISYSAIPE